jgi:O-antigen/teichoic acid export membrane protein
LEEFQPSLREAGSQAVIRIGIFLRAAVTSWISVLANAAAAFVLTPVILRHLGDEAFGVWVLVTTIVNYYGLGDVGVRASVLRYVSRQNALGDKDGVNHVVATAFYFYGSLCVLFIGLSFLLAASLPRFFTVDSNLRDPFRNLFLLAGIIQGLSFPLMLFGASLQAAARYDQVYMLRTFSMLVRVGALVAALHAGGGLFLIGAAALLPNLVFQAAQVPLAMRAFPEMSLHPRWVRKNVLRDMFRYGLVSFAVGTGENLRNYTYPVVIGKLLMPAAVTIFSLPAKLLSPLLEGIGTMTEIVNPVSSQLEAHNDFAMLRRLIQLSVQSSFLILLPLVAFLFIFGGQLLSLWVGPQYTSTYPLLVLLTLGLGTSATQCSAQSMLFGIERHKKLVWYRLGEGLSIVLIGSICLRVWGLVGFAFAIAATLMLTSLVLLPRHLCNILGLPFGDYFREACLKPCSVVLPTAVALLLLRWLWVVSTWPTLICSVLLAASVYVLTLLLLMFRIPHGSGDWLSIGILEALAKRLRGLREMKPQISLTRTRHAE